MKKVDPSDRAKKVSLAISLVREKKDKFEREELSRLLSKAGCPYSLAITSLLIKEKIIHKEGFFYQFATPEPVYYKSIEAGVTQIAQRMMASVANSPSKQKTLKLQPIISEEQAMITFLKNKGYKVFAPITEYKEC